MRNLEFQLDWVFDGNESQAQVFDRVARDRVAKVRGQWLSSQCSLRNGFGSTCTAAAASNGA